MTQVFFNFIVKYFWNISWEWLLCYSDYSDCSDYDEYYAIASDLICIYCFSISKVNTSIFFIAGKVS